jgi:hypothetical protein
VGSAAGSWSPPVQLPGSCGGSVAVNAAGAQAAAGFSNADMSVQVCTSGDGQTWSAPVTLAQGVTPAVAIAPDGRAVAVWVGGPGTAPTVQASVRPPGGQWSTAVTLTTDAYGDPVIGIDGSGNAIAAWAGGSGAILTASLPAAAGVQENPSGCESPARASHSGVAAGSGNGRPAPVPATARSCAS